MMIKTLCNMLSFCLWSRELLKAKILYRNFVHSPNPNDKQEFVVKDIDLHTLTMNDYMGKVSLVVNVATYVKHSIYTSIRRSWFCRNGINFTTVMSNKFRY